MEQYIAAAALDNLLYAPLRDLLDEVKLSDNQNERIHSLNC